MTCNISNEQLRAYALGLCEEKEAEEIALHVSVCASCRNELSALERTTAVLTKAFDGDPPDWLMQKTLARVREHTGRTVSWIGWAVPVASGAIIVLLLVLLHPGIRLNSNTLPVASQTQSNKSSNNQAAVSDKTTHRSSLFDVMADDMEIDISDPVRDRSIYESLDIAPEVASLLL